MVCRQIDYFLKLLLVLVDSNYNAVVPLHASSCDQKPSFECMQLCNAAQILSCGMLMIILHQIHIRSIARMVDGLATATKVKLASPICRYLMAISHACISTNR